MQERNNILPRHKKFLLYYLLPLLVLILPQLIHTISPILTHPASSRHISRIHGEITPSQFTHDVQEGKIHSVVIIKPNHIIACYSKHNCFVTIMPTQDNNLINVLRKNNVSIEQQPPFNFGSLIKAFSPLLLIYLVCKSTAILIRKRKNNKKK
jgi:ATP-dependent Zn protease